MNDDLRKYGDPEVYDNSINSGEEPDGSDGGFTRSGNYIVPDAMMEIVRLRKELNDLRVAMREDYRVLHMAVRRWLIGVSLGRLSAESIIDDAHRLIEKAQVNLRHHNVWTEDKAE